MKQGGKRKTTHYEGEFTNEVTSRRVLRDPSERRMGKGREGRRQGQGGRGQGRG